MQGRVARQKAAVPTVSLVGYTNAGKSTLFNLLANSDVYARRSAVCNLGPYLTASGMGWYRQSGAGRYGRFCP